MIWGGISLEVLMDLVIVERGRITALRNIILFSRPYYTIRILCWSGLTIHIARMW